MDIFIDTAYEQNYNVPIGALLKAAYVMTLLRPLQG